MSIQIIANDKENIPPHRNVLKLLLLSPIRRIRGFGIW